MDYANRVKALESPSSPTWRWAAPRSTPPRTARVARRDGRAGRRKDGHHGPRVELEGFAAALRVDLRALEGVPVRDGDHAPAGVMYSAAMALWPAEAPPHAPLGFGSLDALDGLAKAGRIVSGRGEQAVVAVRRPAPAQTIRLRRRAVR